MLLMGAPSDKEIQSTELIHVQVDAILHEHLPLLVTVTTEQPIILELLWLQCHNPVLSWRAKEVLQCHMQCFNVSTAQLASTCIETPEIHKSMEIPALYHAFTEVFSKVKAVGLSPHRI